MAAISNSPQGLVPRHGVVVVKSLGLKERLNSSSGFISLVERHLVEQVMSDMGGSDLVVEEAENSIWSIDGGECSPDPGPFLWSILGYRGITMLKPSVSNQPKVAPHVRESVPKEYSQESNFGRQFQ
mmetsp:Transcript_22666/g.34573  ORF Transcript_22666/g.34573 Transcript_22666/m.34573 type:complete len:127 (-) Transcript_22666:866-1246(-)